MTEAGDELGSFDHNIAIHSRGSGNGIESCKHVQDFGHQGDGFWLQGGNVSLTNNVVAGQRHSGYVFFPVGLNQKGLGVTTIHADELADPAWANGKETVAVGDVPLREFDGNVAFASGDGFESWFTLLNVKDARRTFITDFATWNVGGNGIFTPYTNQMTFTNVRVTGLMARPRGVGFARNHVTRSIVYDHVDVQGYEVGIDVPVNGNSVIRGGTFNNVIDMLITTAEDRGRTVEFIDSAAEDPMGFLTLSPTALNGRKEFEIYLKSDFDPFMLDLTTLFNPDIIRMGTVRYNGMQLYYFEQASDYVPFKSGSAPAYVPVEFLDKTNQDLFDQYGLAIGGIVAPQDASESDPKINALLGSESTYQVDLRLVKRQIRQSRSRPLQARVQILRARQSQGQQGRVGCDSRNRRDDAAPRLERADPLGRRPCSLAARLLRQHPAVIPVRRGDAHDHQQSGPRQRAPPSSSTAR